MYFAKIGKRSCSQFFPFSSGPYFCDASRRVRPDKRPFRNFDSSSVIQTSPINSFDGATGALMIRRPDLPFFPGAKTGARSFRPQILGLKTGESWNGVSSSAIHRSKLGEKIVQAPQ